MKILARATQEVEETTNKKRRTQEQKTSRVEQASDTTEPVDRVVLGLRSDHSKEVTLWEVVRGRDNGLSSKSSPR